MSDHTINAMRAAARSMRDVVLPALDPTHPLAAEQAGLIAKYLDFWADRMPRLGARNVAELRCYVGMGEAVEPYAEGVSPAVAAALADALAAARSVLARTDHDGQAVREALDALTQTITALVRVAAEAEVSTASAIERAVAAHSRDVASLQRAWFAPQGWEDPTAPALDDVLADILNADPTKGAQQ